jgi:hypothetical protein
MLPYIGEFSYLYIFTAGPPKHRVYRIGAKGFTVNTREFVYARTIIDDILI